MEDSTTRRHPFSSEEQQTEQQQQLRWECFVNNLAQRMGKPTVKKKDTAAQEGGSKETTLKSLAPDELSEALMYERSQRSDSSRGNKAVDNSVLTRTTDENVTISRKCSSSSSVPMEESGPTKIYFKRDDPAKEAAATMTEKPPSKRDNSVSIKSLATTSTLSWETTPSHNDFPSVGTDSIAYTGSYTRASTWESLVEDESTIGTLPTPFLITIERVFMILSSLFLCNRMQGEST